jgi:[phosphatase 2A protein]-leucine-carboxy methyltransferase
LIAVPTCCDGVSRVSQLELLDEVEELELVLGHYAISWGALVGKELQWKEWGLKEKVRWEEDDE